MQVSEILIFVNFCHSAKTQTVFKVFVLDTMILI